MTAKATASCSPADEEYLRLLASCACGQVEIEAVGAPIASTICYCDDCQAAAALIEAMPGAPSFREPDGGTSLIVFREDRVRCVRGEANLKKLKLREELTDESKTRLVLQQRDGPGFR